MKNTDATYLSLVQTARSLKSESGENPEYDRALVELLSDVFYVDRKQVAADVGVDLCKLYPGAFHRQGA